MNKKIVLSAAIIFLLLISVSFFYDGKESYYKKNSENLMKYLTSPDNYSAEQTVEQTNEFYLKFKTDYNVNQDFDSSNMMISRYTRDYFYVCTEKNISKCSFSEFQIKESENPKFLSYTPEKSYTLTADYTYFDENGSSYPVTDQYKICYYNNEIVYFLGIHNSEDDKKPIMDYTLEIEKAKVEKINRQ